MGRRTGAATEYLVRTPAQLRSLRSPARQEILDVLSATGEVSIAELAAMLGRVPQALYYHLRALERVSLVRRTGNRRNGKSDATLYSTPAPSMVIEYRLASNGFVADITRIMRSMLRLTERDFARALRSPSAVTEGPRRNLRLARGKARLTDQQLERLNVFVARVFELLAASQGKRSGRLHALTLVVAPLEDRA